jgi:hypothetical protein
MLFFFFASGFSFARSWPCSYHVRPADLKTLLNLLSVHSPDFRPLLYTQLQHALRQMARDCEEVAVFFDLHGPTACLEVGNPPLLEQGVTACSHAVSLPPFYLQIKNAAGAGARGRPASRWALPPPACFTDPLIICISLASTLPSVQDTRFTVGSRCMPFSANARFRTVLRDRGLQYTGGRTAVTSGGAGCANAVPHIAVFLLPLSFISLPFFVFFCFLFFFFLWQVRAAALCADGRQGVSHRGVLSAGRVAVRVHTKGEPANTPRLSRPPAAPSINGYDLERAAETKKKEGGGVGRGGAKETNE